ncbi:peptidase S49 [Loktanella sp. 3ANDIMAR09]|uniref:S49 family peptidase n=1 Tax=Loktanella sp. 3ANDIMAR09 TaxID=1225657 RepID=UPI000700E296|nr:S49 family peptidase [Loktanella sp. 3ANDIMAR09]KQI66960.1 peptidase S49 [Loktanella sp. 3ANDIMAR09]
MTRQTMAALWQGAATALCAEHAGAWMAVELAGDVSAFGGGGDVDPSDRFVVQRGVAIVPLTGLLTPGGQRFERMGWSTYRGIAETMAILAAADDVAAIVLDCNSPGGAVIGIDEAVQAVAQAATVKPVHALINPLATSAAYWVASQATDITLTPGAQVGSIGVQYRGFAPIQPGMDGDQEFVIRSSHARAKNADPSTEVGAALIQAQLDRFEVAFHAAIAAGRNMAAADVAGRISATDNPADGGGTFGFAEAQARGLADATQTRDAFYAQIFARYAPKPRATGARAYGAAAAAAAAIAAS